jgi:trans-aconitate methyltransferase
MDPYQISIDSFNDLAECYQEKYFHLQQYNASYDFFCEHIQKEQPGILELGCGPGNITKYMLTKRPDFKILATDAAPKMLELTKQNNPSLEVQVLDVRNIKSLNRNFDGIVVGFCLPYLNRKDAGELLENCYGLLEPGGILYLSTMEGEETLSGKQTNESTGRSVYMYYHTESSLMEEALKKKYEVLKTERLKFEMPGNK